MSNSIKETESERLVRLSSDLVQWLEIAAKDPPMSMAVCGRTGATLLAIMCITRKMDFEAYLEKYIEASRQAARQAYEEAETLHGLLTAMEEAARKEADRSR